jgi:hypothetical protein
MASFIVLGKVNPFLGRPEIKNTVETTISNGY